MSETEAKEWKCKLSVNVAQVELRSGANYAPNLKSRAMLSVCAGAVWTSAVSREGCRSSSTQCDTMVNGGRFSKQSRRLTNVSIRTLICDVILKVNQVLVNPQDLMRGFIT